MDEDASSLFCDVVVALYCMCVFVGEDVSPLFCDVVGVLYCMCMCG